MEFIDLHSSVSEIFNFVLDKLASTAFWIWLTLTILRNTRTNIAKEGIGKGLYMGIVVTLEAGALVFLIYFPLPQILVKISRNMLELATARWIILYLAALIWSYRVSYKTSGRRGMMFTLLILTIFLFGWLYDRWLGMFAMSLPVLLIYLYMVYKLAQVILPASNPEDKEEMRKKARVFFMYLLGVQHPIWAAEGRSGRVFKKQLEGDATNNIGKPGVIWTWSHQVAGIVKGVGFNRVDGPGLIFTEPRESPVALVDLRMQSRISVVNTVTKDGMEVPTVVFIAFAIDRRDMITAQPLRRRLGNGANFNLDHTEGNFAYSAGRVRSVLSTTGIINPRPGENEGKHESFWDEWVVEQVEHGTRLVIADRNLDELWHPQQDELGASALNEIATNLQSLLSSELAKVGLNLIAARVVNYQLPPDHHIVEQNIKTWSSYWEQQITEANADIEMIYREEIEKAHAYSKSILLSAIADSIAKARSINKDLPRHVIAQYFIHALEEYIKGQPGLNVAESKKRLETVKEILINNRMEGNE